MEDFRRRRLLELQAQLEEKRSTYAEAHPVIIGLRKEIDSLSGESVQITSLREQERQLREAYVAQQAAEAAGARVEGRPSTGRSTRESRTAGLTQDDRVKDTRTQYLHLVERVNAAEIELDATRAAFRHRYSVVWPAEVPLAPYSPNPLKVFPIGAFLSVLLGVLAALAPDLRSRRIYEPWQIEKGLGIPLLSDVERK